MFDRILQILEMRVNNTDIPHSDRCVAMRYIQDINLALEHKRNITMALAWKDAIENYDGD